MAVFGSFILGSDTDNENIFNETAKFITETNIPFAMINILTPPPGTNLYIKLAKENRLLNHEWQKCDGEHSCFKTNLISHIELQKKRCILLKHIYSYENIYKRLRSNWDKGILVRDLGNRKLFTRGRIFFTLKTILSVKFNRKIFILKSLWNKNITSIMAILLAINFHKYAFNNNLNDNV